MLGSPQTAVSICQNEADDGIDGAFIVYRALSTG